MTGRAASLAGQEIGDAGAKSQSQNIAHAQ